MRVKVRRILEELQFQEVGMDLVLGFLYFALGFVSRKENPDAYTFSVVWRSFDLHEYNRVVWSANRNRPVSSGAWVTPVNGSLVLYDSDGAEVWSTHTDNNGMGIEINSQTGEFTVYGDRSQTIWSSFSHPTDTIVAGQQLVWGMQLVSGNSSTNNSEGAYSLIMKPAGLVLYASLPDPQPYFVWNYYAQSPLTDRTPTAVSSLSKTYQDLVALVLPGYGLLSLVLTNDTSPGNKNYTSQALCNLMSNYSSIRTDSYPSTANTTFMVLESDGSLKVYIFNQLGVLTVDYDFFSQNMCDLPEICGGYGVCKANGQCECPIPSDSSSDPHSFMPTNSSDPTKGCSYSGSSPLKNQCSTDIASAQVHMSQVNAVDYYSNRFADTGINTSMTECNSLCMSNCSCTASFYDSGSNLCYSVYEPPLSMISTANSNLTAFFKLGGVATLKKKSPSGVSVGIGVGVASFVIICVVAIGFVAYVSHKRAKAALRSKEDEFLETLPGLPPRYSKKEMDGATMGFTKLLGSGGFGSVYEGSLPDGTKIAVKRLESSKGTKDFRAEMATLGSIHHHNLVRLRGFCAEGVDNMLVYEFMPNGSLDRWLFSTHYTELSTDSKLYNGPLDWETRFKIALGTACGLAYLHEECSERIIHLDIKPQNILLDFDFSPKVADFGLSKLVDRDLSMVVTTMKGTPGYLAPEWLLEAGVTEKTDVFSYGIVLLELVAGRKCMDRTKEDRRQRYVPVWLLHCIRDGDILEILDPRLQTHMKEFEQEQVRLVIHIALQCIQEDVSHRPSMGVVVQMLEGLVRVPDLPIDHTLYTKYRFAHALDSDLSRAQLLTGFESTSSTFSRGSFSVSSMTRKSRSNKSLKYDQM
ncbi:unnamed protein product [Calypogeia fissa]